MLALFTFSTGAQTPNEASSSSGVADEAARIIPPGVNATNPRPLQDAPLQEVPVPSWFEGGKPEADALLALKTLIDAQTQGLNPQDYHVAELSQAFQQASQDHAEPAMTARLDGQLTEALVRYLRDLHQGRLNPDILQHRFKTPPLPTFNPRSIIANARTANRLEQALDDAVPKVPM